MACERVYVFVCLCEHKQLWKWRCLLWPVLGLQPWLAGRGGSQDTERYCVVLTAFQPAGSQEQCQIKANRGKKLTISQRTATVSYKFKVDMNIMIRTCYLKCFLCLGRNIYILFLHNISLPECLCIPCLCTGEMHVSFNMNNCVRIRGGLDC